MKVMAVLGSPQKNGNSGILAQKFLDKAAAAGFEPLSHLQDLHALKR